MPALSHIGLGLAAKPAAPEIPIGVLIGAALAIDILYGAFALVGIVGGVRVDSVAWSHSLPMAAMGSIAFSLLALRIYRDGRAAFVSGLLVFSHWVLDFLMWPPSASLLYPGGPAVGLNLGQPIGVSVVFEFGMLILGAAVWLRIRKRPAG